MVNQANQTMRRAKALFTILILAFLGCLPPANSARAALQFDVFAGYDGSIREASWFPIIIEVFNDGPSFNAIIEVSTGGQFGTDQVRQVPIELPTNTRKRVVIPMFASGARYNTTWNGRLLDTRGKVIQGAERLNLPTKVVAWESTILGAVPRNFGGSPVLPDVSQTRQHMKPEVARMTYEQFPDNPIALEGMNVLYLNSEKAPDLRVPQVTALLAWVRGGGHLIVAAEQLSDINGTPWLKQFLPMDLTDTRNLKIDEDVINWVTSRAGGSAADEITTNRRTRRLTPQPTGSGAFEAPMDPAFRGAELPVAVGTVRDGSTLFMSGDQPLAVQAPRGRGKVTVLAFSPEREPFRSWKARQYFWAKLAGMPSDFFTAAHPGGGYGGWSIDGVFGALIDSRQIKKLPVTWLLLLLVVYLVVIGPFDQWWLKKINRQMLTWITFPSYVVLFSLLIYFIGYKLRAGETEWNELNIVDVLPRGDKVDMRGRTYISIYSSGNNRFDLNGQKGFATLRSEFLDFHAGGRESSKARVTHTGDSFEAQVDGLVWTSSLWANDWFKTNDTPFVANIVEQGGTYQVDIQNLMDRELASVRVVAGQHIFEVDAIPAREKKSFTLATDKGTPLRPFVQQHGSYFQRAVDLRRNPLGDAAGGQLEDRPLVATTASFISYLDELTHNNRSFLCPPGLDLTAQVERGDAVIFAFLPGFSFTDKINDFQPPRFRQDTLLRLTLPVRPKI